MKNYVKTVGHKMIILWLIFFALVFIMTVLPGACNAQSNVQALVTEFQDTAYDCDNKIVGHTLHQETGVLRIKTTSTEGTMKLMNVVYIITYIQDKEGELWLHCVKEEEYPHGDPIRMHFYDNGNNRGGLWVHFPLKSRGELIRHYALTFM